MTMRQEWLEAGKYKTIKNSPSCLFFACRCYEATDDTTRFMMVLIHNKSLILPLSQLWYNIISAQSTRGEEKSSTKMFSHTRGTRVVSGHKSRADFHSLPLNSTSKNGVGNMS